MIPIKKINEIRHILRNAKNPLFFFDDDVDGCCAYILLRNYVKAGKGVIFKSLPVLNVNYLKIIDSYYPDLIVVLDISDIEQEFLDKCKIPILWIDHHSLVKKEKVKYFNPKMWRLELSTTEVCYYVAKNNVFVATLGAISDWTFPKYVKLFARKFPELLPKDVNSAPMALFETRLGEIIKVFLFNLKGNTRDVLEAIEIFRRIEDPYEILNMTTGNGTLLMLKATKMNKEYKRLLSKAEANYDERDKILLFIYPDNKFSFTAELSNELIYKFPRKIIIIGREKGDEIKISFRSASQVILDKLERASRGLNARFGGHQKACGGVIKNQDFDRFLANFRDELEN